MAFANGHAAPSIPGDPDAVRTVAHRLRQVSDDVGHIRASIGGARHVDNWSGEASEAFRATLGELPSKLVRVQDSYGLAAGALDHYATRLRDVQDQSHAAARDLSAAQNEAHTQASLRDRASRDQVAAERARDSTLEPGVRARYEVVAERARGEHARAIGGLRAAEHEAGIARARADGAHAAWEDAVEACRREIERASHAGIRNSLGSAWDRHVVNGIPGQAVEGIGMTLAAVGDGVVQIVTDFARLPAAVWAWAKDPSAENWRDMFTCLGATLTIAGTILVVAALIVATVGTGGAAAPGALAALAAASKVVAIGSVATATGKAGTGVVLVAQGRRHPSILVFDALDVAVAGRGVHGASTSAAKLTKMNASVEKSMAGLAAKPSTYQFQSAITSNTNKMREFVRQPETVLEFGVTTAYTLAEQQASALEFDPTRQATPAGCIPPPATCRAGSGLAVVHAIPPPVRVVPTPPTPTLAVP